MPDSALSLSWFASHPLLSGLVALSTLFFAVFLYDVLQRRHAILHNFPIVGHFRYLLETIGPELRQYWVANDKEERPFSRHERSWVYASAKGQNSNQGFGTTEILDRPGYPIIKHSAFPFPSHEADVIDDDPTLIPCLKVIGELHDRRRPYRPMSIVNVSAMSFGSLGERAVRAINQGVAKARCYHNTGEGGVSPYHLEGGELVYQLGTGYFGARDGEGRLDFDRLAALCDEYPQVRAIELKLSQGAKPGKGGILPAAKITAEIAKIRGIPMGADCLSPNAHVEFSTVDELIDFVERMADAGGVPVGIKSAVGDLAFWNELARRMAQRGEGPDFLAVDGGEGGTGSAPLTFADHVSLPFNVGFKRVYRTFLDHQMAEKMVWIGSGKLGFPDRAAVALAMGCDLVQVAREAMLAIGCIQAQKCHDNFCPAGVATHNRWLQAGLDVELKGERLYRYVKSFRKELLALAHAAGHQHPSQFTGADIDLGAGVNLFDELEDVLGYVKPPVHFGRLSDYRATP